MLNDLRVALRTLVAKPGFAVLASLTIALGVGASAAVFSLLDGLYFRPVSLREPERLVRITRPSPKTVFGLASYPEFRELAEAAPALSDVVAMGGRGLTLHQDGEARLLIVKYVSPSFFATMGIPVAQGRGLGAADARSDAPLVVVNHQLWQERLGGRADVIGSTVQLNDTRFTVVGVTAPGFVGLEREVRSDVFILAEHAHFAVRGLADELASRGSRWFEIYGRLASGASLEQARAQLDAVSARWVQEDASQYAGAGLRVFAFNEDYRGGVRRGAVFLGLVVLVLLIACANAANLTLARSEGRRRELAVRAALGASRGRLLRALVAESLMLSTAGTAMGLALAAGLIQLFPSFTPPGAVPYVLDARFDGRLLGFVALLLAATTALVAAVPAWRHSRPDVVQDLKRTQAAGVERKWSARDLIVVTQMAVSVIVLIAAGLLVRSLRQSASIPAGFDPAKRVATFYIVPALRQYDDDATLRFFEEARRRTAALPGVKRASYAIRLPAQGNEAGWAADFFIPGATLPPGEDAFRIRYGIVGPDYFETLGARIVKGRGVRESDGASSGPVAVVNRTLAERFWPGEDPIGKRIVMGRKSRIEREIVGVAEDGRIADLHEAREAYVFVPFAQQTQGFALLLVETAGPPESIFGAVKGRIAELDPGLAILEMGTLKQHREAVLFDESRDAWIGAGVGVLGLALGMVGLYGVVSLVTVRRTKEIGLRIALGARPADVLRLVLGRGFQMAVAGSLLGVAVGLAGTRLLASRLHGIAPTDAATFVGGVLCLLVAALLATALPALRAARIDPMAAIREE